MKSGKIIRQQASSYLNDHKQRERERRRFKKALRKLSNHYIDTKRMRIPGPGGLERVDVIARGLIEPFPARVAAFIQYVKYLELKDEVAKRFCHTLLSWTWRRRHYRFPKKYALIALEKLDDCSSGRISDEEARDFIQHLSYIGDRLNGHNIIGYRKTPACYKNAIFQAAIGNALQYGDRKEEALETTILAAAVNVRNEDPISQHAHYLNKIRLN